MGLTRSCAMYSKRDGTSGIKGQLYETKLISLLYFRASRDETIEEFQLASNIDNIGAFDDICLKVKLKDRDKPVALFIQVKHRENKKHPLEYGLRVYFDSYLQIRKSFKTSDKDVFFRGEFEETECLFVIYTNAMDYFNNDAVDCSFGPHLQELIGTGGMAKQPYRHQADVECLQRTLVKHEIKTLAERIAKFISKSNNKDDLQNILADELVQCYHVIVTQTVFDVSDIVPKRVEVVLRKGEEIEKEFPSHRIASFCHNFFDTNNENLSLFRDTLFKEILKERKIKASDVKNLISEFMAEPTDVTKLSKLIGTVVTYNNEKLEYLNKKASAKGSMPQLNRVNVSLSMVNEAMLLAAREILLCREFQVPVAFGNKDLTIRDAKVESRINDLASVIKNVIVKCDASYLVTIDESLGKGFLQLNGGLAGAIGNIFVLHDDTKLMKITNKKETLGDLAKKLYERLYNEIPNLHEYKFCFNLKKFPKLSFNLSEYENNLVKDFLNKLLFFTNQADENNVEDILKEKIDVYQFDHQNYFQAKTDAMFLKYHDEIQKWWMQPIQAMYLTKDSDVFENAIHNIIKDPLLSSIKVIYMSKIKHFIRYTFTEDAVSSWNLQDHSSTFIITENSELTVVKVLQYLKNKDKDHVVLDFEYIVDLPKNDHNALRKELTNKNGKENVIYLVVCDKTQNYRNETKTLEIIANIILNKNTIIITNFELAKTLQKHFPRVDNIVHDEKNSLIDMSKQSQNSILESTFVMFQGVKVRLNLIVTDDKSRVYVKGDILNKIISYDTIKLGKLIVARDYDEIKHPYVDRWVQKTGSSTNKPLEESPPLKTLYDIEDDVVLVTAEPGMGKSTLLTHLSLGTKIDHPDVWIVRVNLLEYSRELSNWKEDKRAVDLLKTLKFMCQIILREKLSNENYVEIVLEEQNGVVCLKHCKGDQLTEFELKLFLHFFNEGKVIFLFDGFDEICPHYTNETIKCIKVVNSHPKKHKIWVTSRSYTHVITTLKQAFGEPYEIEHFSIETMKEYLNNIWKSNLILKELDRTQLENVYNFLEFMSHSENRQLQQRFELTLHEIYIHAAGYLINEVKDSCDSLWTFDRCYNDIYYKAKQKNTIFSFDYFYNNIDTNPLNLFLRAHFFISNIKDVSKTTINWNQDVNTFSFYEQYLKEKLKNIRFEVKNKMDTSKPDNKNTYEKELKDFVEKHKKMAAYAIFNQYIDKLFSVNDVQVIKETLKCIEEGVEKTGVICSVANEIPIFIHMTFTEYFAVEYVCDLLKNANESENHILWIKFIFNEIFSGYHYGNVRKMFDYKMKIDETLLSVIQRNKEVLFNLLMKKIVRYNKDWPPVLALIENLHNCIFLFASIFESYINDSNLEEFLKQVSDSELLYFAVRNKCKQFAVSLIDIIKKLDNSKLNSVLQRNYGYLRHSSVFENLCANEIIDFLSTHLDFIPA